MRSASCVASMHRRRAHHNRAMREPTFVAAVSASMAATSDVAKGRGNDDPRELSRERGRHAGYGQLSRLTL